MSGFGMKWNDIFRETVGVHRGLAALKRAYEGRRLPHAVLFSGKDKDFLENVALGFADFLLGGLNANADAVNLIALRPANKMRQIGAERTRELVSFFQKSANGYRVALVLEADRMHVSAANIFLKTLEEPPADSLLLLTSTSPESLLDTVKSRCIEVRFHQGIHLNDDRWTRWLSQYRAFLDTIDGSARSIMTAYALVANFDSLATAMTPKMPDSLLSEEERVAIQTSAEKGLIHELFLEIAQATSDWAFEKMQQLDTAGNFVADMDALERGLRLIDVNLSETAVLEHFLLSALKNHTAPIGLTACPR
ncbi:MAG TPA: DNA polymerase III subunit gamma/tau [Opitutae bacterium]|nr:DNA polymerase III subunit gamma/tau [Opitutae bacterium]